MRNPENIKPGAYLLAGLASGVWVGFLVGIVAGLLISTGVFEQPPKTTTEAVQKAIELEKIKLKGGNHDSADGDTCYLVTWEMFARAKKFCGWTPTGLVLCGSCHETLDEE